MSYLSLTDLFLVGLALDISGAVLLAKGLLLSPRELAKLNTNWGVGYGQHEDRLQNRVAGKFGVLYLVGGFTLQAAGYTTEIGGAKNETGITRMVVAIAAAVLIAGIAAAAWKLFRSAQIEKLRELVEIERPAAAKELNDAEAARNR
jgi:hypothetical protein